MTVLDFATPLTGIRAGAAAVQLNDDLWRMTRPTGEVLGYVHRVETPAGPKFVAKRMLPRQRRFLAVGEFWTVDAAMDCFRF
ncbi:MAG: hypothetical protein ACKVOG_05730 [Rhodoglobus sp.]